MATTNFMAAAHERGFQLLVEFHAIKAAIAIMSEVAGPRTTYAKDVLAGRAPMEKLAIAVLTQVAAKPTGVQIDAAISGIWNAMSGVTG